MFVVIAYDIPDDRRRSKLHTALKHFGTPVQESVFECHLSQGQITKIKAVVNKIIDSSEDQVRYYYLCGICANRIEMTACSKLSNNIKTIII